MRLIHLGRVKLTKKRGGYFWSDQRRRKAGRCTRCLSLSFFARACFVSFRSRPYRGDSVSPISRRGFIETFQSGRVTASFPACRGCIIYSRRNTSRQPTCFRLRGLSRRFLSWRSSSALVSALRQNRITLNNVKVSAEEIGLYWRLITEMEKNV